MNRGYLGIDLGTSSVKVLCRYEDGSIEKSRAEYNENSPEGWYRAVLKAVSGIDTSSVAAIGLSSQVGSYIVNGKEVISWNSPTGADELKTLKVTYNPQQFIKEISMPHPDIISYPIPRLAYIRKRWGEGALVCQPKDMLGKMLTGEYATDKYSWRGLANIEKGKYSDYFVGMLGNPRLPQIKAYTARLGTVSEEVSRATGLSQNVPIYVGMNDFYSALAGMGVNVGDMFDITGTSEHLGIITESLAAETSMVSGPYINDHVHYGVTASSGVSLDFGRQNFGFDGLDIKKLPIHNAPIFTPYLNGERAPIFDSNATGIFFGINGECSKESLAYSVLEGVVFSIYHIWENIGMHRAKRMIVSGGAAKNPILNYLKAEMFDIPVVILRENDASALGASMVAAVGAGLYPDIQSAAKCCCVLNEKVEPNGALRPLMCKRYEIYKELYPQLKDTCKRWKETGI